MQGKWRWVELDVNSGTGPRLPIASLKKLPSAAKPEPATPHGHALQKPFFTTRFLPLWNRMSPLTL
jgi:hypothetical protein